MSTRVTLLAQKGPAVMLQFEACFDSFHHLFFVRKGSWDRSWYMSSIEGYWLGIKAPGSGVTCGKKSHSIHNLMSYIHS